MSETIEVRLPEDIAKRLNKLAKALERSKTYIVKKVHKYIEE